MTKKELEKQIQELKDRVAVLEEVNRHTWFIPQTTNIPYVPPLGGGVIIGDLMTPIRNT